MFRAAAVLAAAALMTFAGCTKVDDTLGSNLVPDNQQMKVGYTTLGARTLAGKLDAAKYVETRLFQSDSLKASNISYGYMGSMLSDTFGLRTAGFLTQYLNVYEVKEGYFGYRPIFDSAQILITITSYGNDTLTPQKYNVYEIKSNKYLTEKPVAAGKTERDTVFYLNFDPVKEGVIDETEGPLFYFTLGGEDKGPATTAVTLEPTESGREYIQRLMLQQGDYKDDYSIYSIDSLEQWVEEFRGFYICPDPAMPLTADRGEGTIFGTTLESSGFAVYGRNRVEADPSLIQDTLQMLYYFYEGSVDHGNVSVNTAYHDYSQAKEALFEIADAREPAAGEADERPETARVRVEGFGGVVSDITFTEAFFEALEREIEKANEAEGKDFRTLAFSQVTMSVYFNDGAYDWQEIVPGDGSGNGSGPDIVRLTDEMTAAPSRLGLYTNYKTRTPIADYNYTYESQYNTTLDYGGYVNRSQGCYKMNITAYAQALWNSYMKEKQAAAAEGRAVDLSKVQNRTIYLAPEAGGFYTTAFGILQGMATDGGENNAPIRLELAYNMIK